MQGFDLSTIQNCYIGGAAASAIYLGSTLVWPTTPHDYSQDYFTIVSLDDNNEIYFNASTSYTLTIDISTDNGSTWTSKTASSGGDNVLPGGTLLATLNTGDKLLIRGNNNQYYSNGHYHSFRSTNFKSCNVEGNIMSLIYGDNFINQTAFPAGSRDNFYGLFLNNVNILSAEHLILPVLSLTQECYMLMFKGCSRLVTPPALPATTLAIECYRDMFSECYDMTAAPDLLATTLVTGAYWDMFNNCESLQYIKCLATDISAQACTQYWVYGDSNHPFPSTGTFVKDANTTWATGSSGIPSGWTVVNNTPSNYTITISDPDQVFSTPPIINANGYQAGAPVSIDMDNVYDQYDGTEDDEFVFDITCSDSNLQYDFLYGEIETDEFGDEISSTNAHLDIQSMPSHNLTFTFTLTSNPDASSDEEGGEEEEPEE